MKTIIYLALFFVSTAFSQVSSTARKITEGHSVGAVENVVKEIYEIVSFTGENTPNWEKVKSLFLPDAIIVLRSSRTTHSTFSVDGFIEDFKNFIINAKIEKNGFSEKIVKMKTNLIGDIAQCFVIYDASIPNSHMLPQRGIDCFHLVYKDGTWKIVSIINEVPTKEKPIPKDLF